MRESCTTLMVRVAHQIFSCYDSLLSLACFGPHDSFSTMNTKRRAVLSVCVSVYINQARGSAEQGTSTPILAQTCAPSGLLEQGNIFLPNPRRLLAIYFFIESSGFCTSTRNRSCKSHLTLIFSADIVGNLI
jgi:hypothetical protein